MTREQVRNRIIETGVVAAIRVNSKEDAFFAAEAVYHGGIPIVEIATTMPDALEVIFQLAQKHSGMVVGAGSVLNVERAQACLNAGAQFLTSDGLHLPVIEFARKNEVVAFPGALTPSEVIAAWNAGCDFVKVVPCAYIGGENYIRSLHRMYPEIPLIAAGGVNQQTAPQYIVAGAAALGVGTELVPPDALRRKQVNRIHELARRFAAYARNARSGELPEWEGTYVG